MTTPKHDLVEEVAEAIKEVWQDYKGFPHEPPPKYSDMSRAAILKVAEWTKAEHQGRTIYENSAFAIIEYELRALCEPKERSEPDE